MAKYKKKTYIVDAIQLKNPMTITVGTDTSSGLVGDWLLTDSTGVQVFVDNTTFLQNYELVTPQP
jgi:hypothetical protein